MRPKGAKDRKPRKLRYPTLRVLASIGYPDARLTEIARAAHKDKDGTFMILAALCRLGLVRRVSYGRYRRVEDEEENG